MINRLQIKFDLSEIFGNDLPDLYSPKNKEEFVITSQEIRIETWRFFKNLSIVVTNQNIMLF
jgi:hypothetical protein